MIVSGEDGPKGHLLGGNLYMNKSVKLVAIFLAATAFSNAFAGQVTFQDVMFDLGSGWRTSTVSKSIDIDGNNVLGSRGYILPDGTKSLPDVLTALVQDPSFFGGNLAYASIDDPTTTPGGNPTLQQSQTFNPAVGNGNFADLLSFTFIQSATFRIGVMVDNLDTPTYNPLSIGIRQSDNSTSAIYTLVSENGNPDWAFFDVTGNAGETFVVSSQASSAGPGYATLGAVAFDSVATPEPSTMLLVGTVLASAGLFRRKLKV